MLALILYSDWLPRFGTILKPEHFLVDDERDVVKWANAYYDMYHSEPTDTDVAEGLNDNPLRELIEAARSEVTENTWSLALEFAQTQAMKLAVLASVQDIDKGDLSNVRDRIETALKVGQDRLNLGWELVRDAKEWLFDDLQGKHFPTGWVNVDNALKGGLVGGEYGLIMAPPGQGKTTALINIGYAMAGLMGMANVTHVSYEMPEQKVLKRYAMRVVGYTYERDNVSAKRYLAELEKRAKQSLRAKLRVVSGIDKTLGGLRSLIDNLSGDGFDTEALIVDYADLMHSPRKRQEYRFELADIARGLRELGEEYGIPVWSASQAGRHALNKEVVTMADIAEAIEKAAIADVIIAICRTSDEQKLGQGRLFAAKLRDAPDKFVVPVKIDFSKQLIIQRKQ